MTAIYYAFAAGIGVGFLIALGGIVIMAALSRMGEDDPEEFEQPRGYVDQDGEATPSRHQWRGNSVHQSHVQD